MPIDKYKLNEPKFNEAEGLIVLADEVLHNAFNDCLAYKDGTRRKEDALNWLASNEDNDIIETGTFTFNYICYLLNLNKEKVRVFINWRIDSGKNKIREEEYSKFLRICSND